MEAMRAGVVKGEKRLVFDSYMPVHWASDKELQVLEVKFIVLEKVLHQESIGKLFCAHTIQKTGAYP